MDRLLGDQIIRCKPGNFSAYAFGQQVLCCNENCNSIRVMFRLRHQIRSDSDGVTVVTGDYNLCRTSKHVNRTIKGHQLLCGCYICVAWADDLIDLGNALRSVRECGNCLSATNSIELCNAEEACYSKSLRSGFWRYYNNSLNTCDLCRDYGHQHGG